MIPAHAILMKKKSKADEVKRLLKHTHSEIQKTKNIHLGRRETDFTAKTSEEKKFTQKKKRKNALAATNKLTQRSSTERVLERPSMKKMETKKQRKEIQPALLDPKSPGDSTGKNAFETKKISTKRALETTTVFQILCIYLSTTYLCLPVI